MSKIKPYFIVFIIILTILGIFYVWTTMESIKLGYNITKLNGIKTKLEHKRKELLIKKTALASPSRIYGIAVKIGFIYPKEGEIIMVHD
jgi:cell division protein FtsL